MLEVYRDIAQQVVDSLGPAVVSEPRVARATPPTQNLEAYHLYQQGRLFWNRRNEENFKKALKCWEAAVKEDKDFALAHVGIAKFPSAMAWYCLMTPKEANAAMEEPVKMALEADSELPEAWAVKALLQKMGRDPEEIERAFQNAIAFAKKDPERFPKGYADAHHWYGNFLSACARHGDALEQALIAQKIDRLSPIITTHVGLRHYCAGSHDQAIEQYDAALNLDPNFAPAHWHKSWACPSADRAAEAIHHAKEARRISPVNPVYTINLAWAYAVNGDQTKARELLVELEGMTALYVSSYHLAAVHTALGDVDEALRHLEQAIDDEDHWQGYLDVDARFIPLRGHPRFASLNARTSY